MVDIKYRIAIDAMGGDNFPEAPVRGALRALKELPFDDFLIQLVGDPDVIEREKHTAMVALRYRQYRKDEARLKVVPATQYISMAENPSEAYRWKQDSSLHVGTRLLKEGKTDAFISAGNTGAITLIARLILRMVIGIKKPALAATFPTIGAYPCLLLDVGATTECRAIELVQLAVMGSVYVREVFGQARPRVGLLSNGTEEGIKGTAQIREASLILEQLSTSGDSVFMNQVEGDAIFSGEIDVVVCDGFVGNVVLKFAESIYQTLHTGLKQKIDKDFSQKVFAVVSGMLLRPTLSALKKEFDYEEYGGMPLLGVGEDQMAVILKAHGKSSPKAIANSIRNARLAVEHDLSSKLVERLKIVSEMNSREEKK